MSTTSVTSIAIVGIVLIAAIIIGLFGLHFWRKRIERLQVKALPDPEPQPIGPLLPAPQTPPAANKTPQAQQYHQHQRHASSPPQMDGMPSVPLPAPMYIQAARRSRSIHLVSTQQVPGQADISPVSPVSPASSASFPTTYPTARPSSAPLPDSTRISLYLSEKDVEAGSIHSNTRVERVRSHSGNGRVRDFISRVALVNSGSRMDVETADEKAKNPV